jgi:hypothetical protein
MQLNEIISRDTYDVLRYGQILLTEFNDILIGIAEDADIEILTEHFLELKQRVISFNLDNDKILMQSIHQVTAEIIAAGGGRYMTEAVK